MNYIVFDLEFNMFFQFKEGDFANPDLKNEIIQIGAVKLNNRLEKIGEFNSLIKPVIYKRMNPFVKKKTNIDISRVAQRRSFVEVIKSFNSWLGNDSVLCSWGQDDILGLRENCSFFGIDAIPLDKFINIQKVYMTYRNLPKQPGLESAVEDLEIEKNLPFHDALSDASYTSDVFRKVYDFSETAIINWEKVQAESEKKIAELKTIINQANIECPECKRFVQKSSAVTKAKKYFAFGYCAECNILIRHVSRIVNKDGEYCIVSNNSIYEKDEK
ncbi:MAG: 3'-5' exonuclease [Bacillota bacterium]|nr:3'-5' exonuclease [Bacillota bacterium]